MQQHIVAALFLAAACGSSSSTDGKSTDEKPAKQDKAPEKIEKTDKTDPPATKQPETKRLQLGAMSFELPAGFTLGDKSTADAKLASNGKGDGVMIMMSNLPVATTKEACEAQGKEVSSKLTLDGARLFAHDRLGKACMTMNHNAKVSQVIVTFGAKAGTVFVSCTTRDKLEKPPAYCLAFVDSITLGA